MKSDVELEAQATDHELTITYRGRTWNLTAYPLEDFGTWEATAHEQGTTTPAQPAADWGVPGLYRDPWTALSILADAIIRQTDARRDADPRSRAGFKEFPCD